MFRNFLWQREDEPQNMLAYVFLYINVVYGFVFLFQPESKTVTGSSFYMNGLPPQAWGVCCLALVVATLTMIQYRLRVVGEAVGMLGFLLWGYGFQLYLREDLLFPAFAIYLPQMLFWAFWYIGVKRYFSREKDNNETYSSDSGGADFDAGVFNRGR